MSDTGWGQAIRWPMLDLGDADFVVRRELVDRDLEQWLDSPPQTYSGFSFLTFDSSKDGTASLTSPVVRWERQRGRFVTVAVSARGGGGALTAATTRDPWEYGVTLPPGVTPMELLAGYCPALVQWYVVPGEVPNLSLTEEVSYGAVVKRPSDGRWLIVAPSAVFLGWGASTGDAFTVHATFPTV